MRKENALWYGYLEAGKKSTPVVLDRRLPTGNEETIYLFNLTRSEILEYQRHIVEPKLRELKSDETAIVKQLKAAYSQARQNFRSPGNRILHLPEQKPTNEEKRAPEEFDEVNESLEINSSDALEDEAGFDEKP
jgi:hypothetical protein